MIPRPPPGKTASKTILLGLIFLLVFLSACTPDENEAFIQGTWFYNSLHIQEQVGESFLEVYWTFDGGNYETYSCCFQEFQQYGRYDIVESEGDRLVLELFNIDGKFNSERVQILVKIDRQADTISLLRGGPFTRISP
jgi:hypothetical protein